MRQQRARPIRNRVDLADAKQVRLIRKRLRVSEAELTEIVGRIGDSIAGISKEVALQRAGQLPEPAKAPVDAVVASVSVPEPKVTVAPVVNKPEH